MIEFYRTRTSDDAHALVGRETAQVANLNRPARPLPATTTR
ncbi:hypothetical protein [Mesorhizobium sp. M0488]